MISSVLTLLALSPLAGAADLVLDGESMSASGTLTYDSVTLVNGSILTVEDYDGTGETGTLAILADSIYVDATSSIVASGAGYRGVLDAPGEGPGGGDGGSCCRDSGGGGAHGGDGGMGTVDGCSDTDGTGGDAYADESVIGHSMGSAGGSAGTADGDSGGYGGDGGGSIWLQAALLTIEGTLQADGRPGSVTNNDASGGGAGGGILLVADTLVCTGTLSATGGEGANTDDGGGGGGGGFVRQLYDTAGTTCAVDVSPGDSGCYAEDGSIGISASGTYDFDGDGYTWSEGDCDPQDGDVNPGESETWYDGTDADCDGESDYDADGDGYDSDLYGGEDCDDGDG
ncbi:hypothetical protein L6R53_32005, partial [Myxococcota bacterium]|nr:hypothetical protein [Myxococcota bacterium]